ncbi:type I-F CRISPR-associated protein Csy2 [Shewanella sp. WXL01]|uniref:type I-F CRISPR-associated protein Csy2 n=1 Tax=Shewanella sp. WXL01 TaxID=2709721 RepID=UPI0014386BFF|nr:type I-F CRISPR-associated protein Csy2 [Shewanella sp. WXL01]NKF51195.1 type I-F CRISPR-associated protein Csy2 [Shewanella sp. WXL01]
MNVLVLPRLKVHNANALSSPFTIGFPAMTAWLGFVHALERKLNQKGYQGLILDSVGVISHDFNLQTHKGEGDFVHSIIGTANPLDKDGSRSAFIEEGRCHLEASLVINYEDDGKQVTQENRLAFIEVATKLLSTMKLAGGDILSFKTPFIKWVNEPHEQQTLLNSLMPGYALIERRDLMIEAMSDGKDALDAMLSYLTVNHSCQQDENGDVSWHTERKASGWIVPIATGFQGISELGSAKNQRDPDTPHRFAESVVTLGEFVMAHKIASLDALLWHYFPDSENKLYLCQQASSLTDE